MTMIIAAVFAVVVAVVVVIVAVVAATVTFSNHLNPCIILIASMGFVMIVIVVDGNGWWRWWPC